MLNKKMKKTEAEQETRAKKSFAWGTVLANVGKFVTAAAVILVLFWFGFVCELREGNCAVILRFGAVRQQITEAGVYLKLPWPFETVVTYDGRLQYLESGNLETTTRDKRNIVLQSYVVWSIEDPVLYHNSVGVQNATDTYINEAVKSATNGTLGGYDLEELVSLEAETIKIDKIQEDIFQRVAKVCRENYGVAVSDVSILRLTLPTTNLQSVFDQMEADRQKEIDTILANAQLEADKITMAAAEESAQIVAEGVTQSAKIKAETEAEVAKIYSEAQSANMELYQFLMGLDAYANSVDESTILVVKANEYPFNVLTKYSQQMEAEGNSTVINDLTYILSQLPEQERKALVDAIGQMIQASAIRNGINGE